MIFRKMVNSGHGQTKIDGHRIGDGAKTLSEA